MRYSLKRQRKKDEALLKSIAHLPKIQSRAPEGLGRHKDSYVVVKRNGPKKKMGEREEKEETEEQRAKRLERERYLGYIKPGKNGRPRKFFPRSNNPPEDKWRNKVALKSYREPKGE